MTFRGSFDAFFEDGLVSFAWKHDGVAHKPFAGRYIAPKIRIVVV
jgi:hypothetical protein